MVGGGMQDDLASNLRSKVKKLQYLRVAMELSHISFVFVYHKRKFCDL
jgi:hypothetical protein